jgi:hypothetical protein
MQGASGAREAKSHYEADRRTCWGPGGHCAGGAKGGSGESKRGGIRWVRGFFLRQLADAVFAGRLAQSATPLSIR